MMCYCLVCRACEKDYGLLGLCRYRQLWEVGKADTTSGIVTFLILCYCCSLPSILRCFSAVISIT
jgi:hypothetical protein